MKKLAKIFGILLIVVIVLLGGGYVYFISSYPRVGPPSPLKVEATPARLERGKYLVHHVVICIDCHSQRDFRYFSAPIVPGTEGMGGDRMGEEVGFPGTFFPKNITPAGIGAWTDGELFRMITSGVNKKGKAVFPLMPYPYYNNLSQEDAYSIISYIRTLKPIENQVPESKVNFPLNLIMRTVPREYHSKPAPDPGNPVKYGEYLVTIAACSECHSMQVKGEPVPGMYLAGGFEFKLPNGTLHSANITPDPATGIGGWSKEFFIKRFKYYSSDSAHTIPPDPSGFNTIMPWTMFAGLTEQDLGAIYDYLRTIPPVRHPVEKWTKQKNYDMPIAEK